MPVKERWQIGCRPSREPTIAVKVQRGHNETQGFAEEAATFKQHYTNSLLASRIRSLREFQRDVMLRVSHLDQLCHRAQLYRSSQLASQREIFIEENAYMAAVAAWGGNKSSSVRIPSFPSSQPVVCEQGTIERECRGRSCLVATETSQLPWLHQSAVQLHRTTKTARQSLLSKCENSSSSFSNTIHVPSVDDDRRHGNALCQQQPFEDAPHLGRNPYPKEQSSLFASEELSSEEGNLSDDDRMGCDREQVFPENELCGGIEHAALEFTCPYSHILLATKPSQTQQTCSNVQLCRRLYMDIEREQVRERRRQKQLQKNIQRMKECRELQRHQMEITVQGNGDHPTDSGSHVQPNHQCQDDAEDQAAAMELDRWYRRKQKRQEKERYITALRHTVEQQLAGASGAVSNALCTCSSTLSESHPSACANNCMFRRKPAAYAKGLKGLLASSTVS